MPDLWPDSFSAPETPAPVYLLREQATFISQKTEGRIRGRVTTSSDEGVISHRFSLMVPSLNDYTYNLMTVEHPVKMYPATIDAEVMEKFFHANNYDEFLQSIRAVLRSQQTTDIINALLAQAE